MHTRSGILVFFILCLGVIKASCAVLVSRQYETFHVCAQNCFRTAPIHTCSFTDWNCLCRLGSFMVVSVDCISANCQRAGMIESTLDNLTRVCADAGVTVKVAAKPPQTPSTSTVIDFRRLPGIVAVSSTPAGALSSPPSPSPSSLILSTPTPHPSLLTSASLSQNNNANATPLPTSTETLPSSLDRTTAMPTGLSIDTNPAPSSSSDLLLTSPTNIAISGGPGITMNGAAQPTLDSENRAPIAAIVGGVVAGFLFLIAGLVTLFVLYIRRMQAQRQLEEQEEIPVGYDLGQSMAENPFTPSNISSTGAYLYPHFSKGNRHLRTPSPAHSPSTSAAPSIRSNTSNSDEGLVFVCHQDGGAASTDRLVVELPPVYNVPVREPPLAGSSRL